MCKMVFIGDHLRATYFELKLYALIPIQLTYNTSVYYFVNVTLYVIYIYHFSTKLDYKSYTIFNDIAKLQIHLNILFTKHFLYNLVLKKQQQHGNIQQDKGICLRWITVGLIIKSRSFFALSGNNMHKGIKMNYCCFKNGAVKNITRIFIITWKNISCRKLFKQWPCQQVQCFI